jgi:hypothetical protein
MGSSGRLPFLKRSLDGTASLWGRRPQFVVTSVLFAEVLLLFIVHLPDAFQLDNFAFFDTGANLTAQYLIERGYRPGVDFGYLYGLLGLFTGRFWFGLTGATPLSYEAAMLVCDILVAWAIARLLSALQVGIAGLVIVAATMPLMIPKYYTFSHALEAVCLYHALAELARGKLPNTLAFAAASIFAKPALGYFLGLACIVYMLPALFTQARNQGARAFVTILPAVVVASVLAIVLGASFGFASLVHTVLPLAGRRLYQAHHFGFFNSGRLFWWPKDPSLAYYLGSAAGFWIAASVILLVAGLTSIRRLAWRVQTRAKDYGIEGFILCCLFLHVVAIFVLWGNEFSWTYYCFVPVLGLTAALNLGAQWRVAILSLVVAIRMATLVPVRQAAHPATAMGAGGPARAHFSYRALLTMSSRDTIGGLLAPDAERAEWSHVAAMMRGNSVALLVRHGCGDLLLPGFMKPVTVYLTSGAALPADVSRKLNQLRQSSIVLIPREHVLILRDFPEISAYVGQQFSLGFDGTYFKVYVRAPGR